MPYTKEYRKIYDRQYYLKDKDKRLRVYRNWKEQNPEKVKEHRQKAKLEGRTKEWAKRSLSKPNVKYRDSKGRAERGGHDFNLTFDDFIKFWGKSCHYCGSKVDTASLDRVDNDREYEVDNVVSCCKICNFMKRALSKEVFLEHCKKIVEFGGSGSNG